MKKLLAIMLCAMLIFATPIVASAEAESVDGSEQGTVATENLTTETETATESEISPSDDETLTEGIVDYVKSHIEEIIVIIGMAAFSIIESRLRGKMNGSIGTLNNNAIAIANNSADAIKTALDKVEMLLKNSEEEKKALKATLDNVEACLKSAKLANIEFANELADLLCLANIPNAKKDELLKAHIERVRKLESEEVTSNDGKKA